MVGGPALVWTVSDADSRRLATSLPMSMRGALSGWRRGLQSCRDWCAKPVFPRICATLCHRTRRTAPAPGRRYDARAQVVTDDGATVPLHQRATMVFVPKDGGWRAEAVDTALELPLTAGGQR